MEELTPREHARREKAAKGMTKTGVDMSKMLMPLAIGAIIAGVLAMLSLVLIAGLRAGLILLKAFPLYAVVFFVAVIAWVFLAKRVRFGFLLGLVAAAAVCYFGFKGATSYYSNSERVFPSIYCADYVQAQPDGKPITVYEKRNRKGDTPATLQTDERVTVNGISFDYQEYNITTAAGVTGWVARSAFPEDGADMLALSIGLDGVDAWDQTIDRQTERLMGRFFNIEQKGGGKHRGYDVVEYKEFTLKPGFMNRFTRVGTQTPIVYLTPKAAKKGEQWTDNGTKITLAGVAYEHDCTVIALEIVYKRSNGEDTPYYWLPYGGVRNAARWKASLAVTDLDTGEAWRMMPADYEKAREYEGTGKTAKETQLFFFPPFKSRHFSLAHGGISPLPDGTAKSGYGGILGWASSATGMGSEASKFYYEWNFEEVRVR